MIADALSKCVHTFRYSNAKNDIGAIKHRFKLKFKIRIKKKHSYFVTWKREQPSRQKISSVGFETFDVAGNMFVWHAMHWAFECGHCNCVYCSNETSMINYAIYYAA